MNTITYLTSCKAHQKESTLLPEVKEKHNGEQKREAEDQAEGVPQRQAAAERKFSHRLAQRFFKSGQRALIK